MIDAGVAEKVNATLKRWCLTFDPPAEQSSVRTKVIDYGWESLCTS
jgi:hypothetical protein